MRYIKILVLFALFASLTSCGQNYVSKEFNQETFDAGNGSVAYIKVGKKERGIFGGSETRIGFELRKVEFEDGEFYLTDRVYQVGKGPFEDFKLKNMFSRRVPHDMVMLEPGIYLIDNLGYHVQTGCHYADGVLLPAYTFFSSDMDPIIEGSVTYGAFIIHPGEVVYVGDIFLSTSSRQSWELFKESNFPKVHASVKRKHPHLAPKLREVNFYPAGTPIEEVR